jgi:hypothetical protein
MFWLYSFVAGGNGSAKSVAVYGKGKVVPVLQLSTTL